MENLVKKVMLKLANEPNLTYQHWKNEISSGRNDLGFSAIYLDRSNPNAQNPFILDSKGDGWFRKREGIAKGYGLVIRNLKITSKNKKNWAEGYLLPISITYLPHSADEDDPKLYEKTTGYIYYHKSIEPEDVLSYINKHKDKWIP